MKIKIKDIITFLHNDQVAHEDYYNWGKLESELKVGYDDKKPIEVLRLFNGKYILVEGRHRIKLIKKLYGDEYEVEAKKTYILKILFVYWFFLLGINFWYFFELIKSALKKNNEN